MSIIDRLSALEKQVEILERELGIGGDMEENEPESHSNGFWIIQSVSRIPFSEGLYFRCFRDKKSIWTTSKYAAKRFYSESDANLFLTDSRINVKKGYDLPSPEWIPDEED